MTVAVREVTIKLPEHVIELLEVLSHSHGVSQGGAEAVLLHLAYSAADGVRRPGAWERGWVEQCFGGLWHSRVERDPDDRFHVRPRRGER